MDENRIDVDSMFVKMVHIVAERSTCSRADVGAMLVRDRRPVGMGYNGAPPGMPHCLDEGCEQERVPTGATGEGAYPSEMVVEGCARTVHAEANVIAFAARNGIATHGTTMYCTHAPCYTCAKLMLSAGIVAVKYVREYRDSRGITLLESAGVRVLKYV